MNIGYRLADGTWSDYLAYGIEANGVNGAWVECAQCYADRAHHDYDGCTPMTNSDCDDNAFDQALVCDACGKTIASAISRRGITRAEANAHANYLLSIGRYISVWLEGRGDDFSVKFMEAR